MKALLTACIAIACAASQVTWLDTPLAGRASVDAAPAARAGAAAAPHGGHARAVSEHGASALAAPAANAGGKS